MAVQSVVLAKKAKNGTSVNIVEKGKKMTKKKLFEVTSLSGFIEWVNQLPQLDYGKYLFRGVPNAEYGIQASAYRRPKKDARSFEKFLQINKDLIAEARLRGHGEKDGRKLGDLEILAELQHHGAATCLIDFTYNAQVALYFACQKDFKWEKDSKDTEKAPDGKVYVVLNDPDKFQKIAPDSLEKRIDEFFQGDQLYHWEPGYHNNRVIAQQSIFLFGLHEFDENAACIIKEDNKENILSELERVSGITQTMLFPDFDGFARLYSEDVPYTELSASDYEEYGFEAYYSNQYEEAIKNYDMAIKLSPQDSSLYYWRGRVKSTMRLHVDAIVDFNKAIEMGSKKSHVFYLRGVAKYNLQQYRESITDFDTVIEINPDDTNAYTVRASAKHEVGQYSEAITDYSEAINRDPNNRYNYHRRALSKKEIGSSESARDDLKMALLLAEKVNDSALSTAVNNALFEMPSLVEDDIPF